MRRLLVASIILLVLAVALILVFPDSRTVKVPPSATPRQQPLQPLGHEPSKEGVNKSAEGNATDHTKDIQKEGNESLTINRSSNRSSDSEASGSATPNTGTTTASDSGQEPKDVSAPASGDTQQASGTGVNATKQGNITPSDSLEYTGSLSDIEKYSNVSIAEEVSSSALADIPFVDGFGGLKRIPSGTNTVFGLYGVNLDSKEIRRLIRSIDRECKMADGRVDLGCASTKAVYSSDRSWVCEWKCLSDIGSCEIYKTHLAVAVLRNYLSAKETFIARTNEFNFHVLYRDWDGQWISKFGPFFDKNEKIDAIYNDKYYAGNFTEVIYPEFNELEQGDTFCFEVRSPGYCKCDVDVQSFTVGDCPQLPPDLRSICYKPVDYVVLSPGYNEVCFNIKDDAETGLYTYNFVLTSGTRYIPAGNAFIVAPGSECCLEGTSFKGFLIVREKE